MMKILIGSKTAAATSEPVRIHEGQGYNYPAFPVVVWAWDLDGSETVTVQFPTDKTGGDAWEDMHTLDADSKQISIQAPVQFRVVKSSTVAECGVAMSDVRGL